MRVNDELVLRLIGHYRRAVVPQKIWEAARKEYGIPSNQCRNILLRLLSQGHVVVTPTRRVRSAYIDPKTGRCLNEKHKIFAGFSGCRYCPYQLSPHEETRTGR